MRKTERLVAITLLLQARGKMTAERLGTIMGVSTRTIYRDMDTLSLAHVPVAMDYGPGGGYYLPDDYRIDPTIFTSEEAVALALGGAVAGDYRLFASGDGLRRALSKLEAALPAAYRADVRAARERILFDTTAWYRRPTTTAHLETVRGAVWAARQLDLLYPRSDGAGAQWRRVEPHGLVCKAGVWYLVAYCQMRHDFRTFRVSRIEDLVVRDETTPSRPWRGRSRGCTPTEDPASVGACPLRRARLVGPAAFVDQAQGVLTAPPADDLGLLALQVFVRVKERLDLPQEMGRDVAERVDRAQAGITMLDG